MQLHNKCSMKKSEIKMCDDFVWKIITPSKAREVFDSGLFPVYALYEDDSEGLVENYEDLETYQRRGLKFGIEVGFIYNK